MMVRMSDTELARKLERDTALVDLRMRMLAIFEHSGLYGGEQVKLMEMLDTAYEIGKWKGEQV